MQPQTFEILYHSERIQERVKELAAEIKSYYKNDLPFIIALANGAIFFAADLTRSLNDIGVDTELALVTVSSYGKGTSSNKNPTIHQNLENFDLGGRNVLILDDVLDTGFTLKTICERVTKLGAAECKAAVMVAKPPSARKVAFEADFVGFHIPDRWVEGYGMDTAEKGRGRRDIIAYIK